MINGKAILVLGSSGSGKSTSIRNLNPKETFIFSALGKGLPFKGSAKSYTIWNKVDNPSGNVVVTSSAKAITQWLQYISKNMPEIKTIVIDDSTFLSAKELDRRREEKTYDKFNDIAHDFLTITEVANTLRGDLYTYFMYHTREDGDNILEGKHIRALSHGKMIDQALASIEAQFEIVFLACKINNNDKIEYKFKTRDLSSTAKTPMDLYEEEFIDNDLNKINQDLRCYYTNDCEDEPKVEAKKVKEKV